MLRRLTLIESGLPVVIPVTLSLRCAMHRYSLYEISFCHHRQELSQELTVENVPVAKVRSLENKQWSLSWQLFWLSSGEACKLTAAKSSQTSEISTRLDGKTTSYHCLILVSRAKGQIHSIEKQFSLVWAKRKVIHARKRSRQQRK